MAYRLKKYLVKYKRFRLNALFCLKQIMYVYKLTKSDFRRCFLRSLFGDVVIETDL